MKINFSWSAKQKYGTQRNDRAGFRGPMGPRAPGLPPKGVLPPNPSIFISRSLQGKLRVVGHQIGLKWNNEPSLQSIK